MDTIIEELKTLIMKHYLILILLGKYFIKVLLVINLLKNLAETSPHIYKDRGRRVFKKWTCR